MKKMRLHGWMLAVFIVTDIAFSPMVIAKKANPASSTVDQESLDNYLQRDSNETIKSSSQQEEQAFMDKLQEQRKLELENNLVRAKLENELAEFRAEIEKLRLQREMMALKWDIEQDEMTKECAQELMKLNTQKEQIMAEVALSQAKLAQSMVDFNKVYTNMQNETLLLKSTIDQVKAEIEETKVQKERKNYADAPPTYLDNPLLPDGTLVISDRSVELNGVITPWKAKYVVDTIAFYNNKDKQKPIFIVIENSPGGCGLAGQRILTAMHNSVAPVYVVVKSFAASMAAIITTLATKSYAFPNAIIIHHQPWVVTAGNVRGLKEEVAFLQEFWNRMGGQLAKKMKISLDKLDKLLYEKSSRGDWQEFADNAKKYHWVDFIITDVRDTSTRELPDSSNYTHEKYCTDYCLNISPSMKGTNDKVVLPQLAANDFYYLYNPDNRYQVRAE